MSPIPRYLFIIFLALSTVQSAPARADDESMPIEWKGPTGRVANMVNSYSQPIRGMQSYQERLDLELQEEAVKNFADGVAYTARVTPWGWWRMPEAIGGGVEPSKAQFELKEGWLERAGSNFDLRVGNQIVTWGAADQINPTDVWNPRDLYDPFQSTKLPLFMVKLKVHPTALENVNLEAIVSPFFRPTRLPIVLPDQTQEILLTDSRWLLPVPSAVDVGGVPAPLHYDIAPPTYPKTWQAGARLSVLRIGGWDFSGSYYNGVESTPRMAFTKKGSAGSATLPITITMFPSFHRQEMYGLDGAGSVSLAGHDFGTRFEAAYYKRDNSRAETAPPEFVQDLTKDDYVHAVVGVDYTFPKKLLGTVVYVNGMYVKYSRIGNKETPPGAAVIEGLPDVTPWDDDFVLYIEDRIGSALKLTANGIYSSAHGDAYLSPGAQYNLTDNLKITVGADFFVGPLTGFFGQFHDDRRVNAGVSYVF